MGSKSFDLNIEKILENWEVRHAIREVIANALDEQLLTRTTPVEIKKRGNTWFVRDYGRGIRYTHLTQNENQEKLESPNVIGRFGIGLKDALATFERHNVIVQIRSKFGTIKTTKAVKHGFGDIVTLHAIIEDPQDSEFVGTEFEMQSVDDIEMDAAKALFLTFSDERVLDTTRFGQVISRGTGPGAIYISGVKVAEEVNFLFSYNITLLNAAIKKAINRERSHVGRMAYTDSVKKILLASNSQDIAVKLSADIAHFQAGTMHDELAWLDVQEHAVRILNAQGNVMMVTADEAMNFPDLIDQARENGMTILTIPENLRAKIADTVDIDGNQMVDLTKFTELYNDSFVFEFVEPSALSPQERQAFDAMPFVIKAFGGLPSVVMSIRISNTMRPDLMTRSQTVGCWDPNTESIVIWRKQLKSFSDTAGTLMHELVHAKTGYSDVTRDFETALTGVIGKLCNDLHNTMKASEHQQALPPHIAVALDHEKQRNALLATENSGLHGRLNFALNSLEEFRKMENAQRVSANQLEAELKILQEAAHLLATAKGTSEEQVAPASRTDTVLLPSNERLSSKLDDALKSIVRLRKSEDAEKKRADALAGEIRTLQTAMAKFGAMHKTRPASEQEVKINKAWYKFW